MAGDLAAVGADFRHDGACVVRGLLDDVQVARLSEGVEDNLAAPSERAIERGAESGSGRFFEDFRNWDRVREYEDRLDGQTGPDAVDPSATRRLVACGLSSFPT